MPHKVCFSHSESFLEASSLSDTEGRSTSSRYYLPKMPLEKAVQDFWQKAQIKDVSQIVLSLKGTQTVLKKRLGNAPAVIVTEGFEHWVDMNLPTPTQQFTLQPKRAISPLNPDLIFGLHERMDAKGNPIHKLNEKELEFLVSKLKMSQVETVSVCFLHSDKNSSHEVAVKKYFEEQGFQVFCSYETEISGNERERWLGAILNGYLESTVKDQIDQFHSLETMSPLRDKVVISTGQGLQPLHSTNFFSTLLGDVYLHSQVFLSRSSRSESLFHFGLEGCHLLPNPKKLQSLCLTDLGYVSATSPKHKVLSWSFTQPLKTLFWGMGQQVKESIGYEPGPMCFGRGLQPTLLDLFFLEGLLVEIPAVTEFLNKKCHSRIYDALSSMIKDLKQEFLDKDLLQSTLRLALFELASEVSLISHPVFSGPLAKAMKLALEKHYGLEGIQLIEDFQFPSLAALKSLKGGSLK